MQPARIDATLPLLHGRRRRRRRWTPLPWNTLLPTVVASCELPSCTLSLRTTCARFPATVLVSPRTTATVPRRWTPILKEPVASVASCEQYSGGVAHVMVVAARISAAAVPPSDAKRQYLSVNIVATPDSSGKKKKKKKKKKKQKKGAGGGSGEPVMEFDTQQVGAQVDESVVRVVSEAGGRSAAGEYSAVVAWGEYAPVLFRPFPPVNDKAPTSAAKPDPTAGGAAPPTKKKGAGASKQEDDDVGAPPAANARSGTAAEYVVKGGGKNGAFRMADQLPELRVALVDKKHGDEVAVGTLPLEAMVLPCSMGSAYVVAHVGRAACLVCAMPE